MVTGTPGISGPDGGISRLSGNITTGGGGGGGGISSVTLSGAGGPFAVDGDWQPLQGYPTYPQAFFDATGDKTWITYTSVVAAIRYVTMVVYNHVTQQYGNEIQFDVTPVAPDSPHDPAGIVMDQFGYVHAFYTSLSVLTELRYSYTATPRDETVWTSGPPVTGLTNGAYQCPVLIGGKIYLFFLTGTGGNFGYVVGTPAATGGLPTLGIFTLIANWGTFPSGIVSYFGPPVVNGTKICFPLAGAPAVAISRIFDVYYGCFDTADLSWSAIDGTHKIVAGSLPFNHATAVANYLVATTTVATNSSIIPAQVVDGNSTTHIIYADGPVTVPGSTNGVGIYNLLETHWTGTAWSAAATVGGNQSNYFFNPAAVIAGDGGFDVYWGQVTNTLSGCLVLHTGAQLLVLALIRYFIQRLIMTLDFI